MLCIRNNFRRLTRQRRASVALSFAFNLVPLLIFLFAILNLGDLGLTINTMLHGVQTAARDATVQTSAAMAATDNPAACATQSQILADFNAMASPILPPAVAAGGTGTGTGTGGTNAAPILSSTWANANPATGATGAALTVSVSFTWVPLGLPQNFGPGLPLTFSATQVVIGTSEGVTSCS